MHKINRHVKFCVLTRFSKQYSCRIDYTAQRKCVEWLVTGIFVFKNVINNWSIMIITQNICDKLER